MRVATYSASRPTPGSTIELKAYWKHRPQKNNPGAPAVTPRSSSGQPSAPNTGNRIQSKTCRKPVHHTTFATSTTRPPSSTGRPSRTPTTRSSTRSTPRAARSARLTLSIGPPWKRTSFIAFRPIGVRRVITCRPTNRNTGRKTRAPRLSSRPGIWPGSTAQHGVVRAGDLVRDVGARVRPADHEHGTVLELVRAAVLAGVQLVDRRVQVDGEFRQARGAAEGAGRNHDVVGQDLVGADRDEVAAAGRGREAVHPGPGAYR